MMARKPSAQRANVELEPLFDPSALNIEEIKRALRITGKHLPSAWVAGRLPRPTLPIDKCVQALHQERTIRDVADLQSHHKFGSCPYAVARYAVYRAAFYAHVQHLKDAEIKPPVVEALKYLKDEAPKLCKTLEPALGKVKTLLEASDQCEADLLQFRSVSEALLVAIHVLEKTRPSIAALHGKMTHNPGQIWRRRFITALFADWWLLTAQDPVPTEGPFQRFVAAAWCSLSLEAVDNGGWESAIKVARSHCEPGGWRVGPNFAR